MSGIYACVAARVRLPRQASWSSRVALLASAFLTAFAIAGTPAHARGGGLFATDLTTEHQANPLGIDASAPRLGWIVQAGHNGARQTAYEIKVSSNDYMRGDVWSSSKVRSTDSFDVEYAGRPLRSQTRYFWSVRVWDERGRPSKWSKTAWFETAFLDDDEFRGDWINSGEATIPSAQTPELLLRKDFGLDDRKIASARAYVAGLGLYKLYVNGNRVGDRELDPAFTEYEDRVMYSTFDITRSLRRGRANALGVSLGHGWYPGYPTVKLKLDVTYTNGRTARVVTDTSWRTHDGPTRANSIQGETYDARLEQPGWNGPNFDDTAWSAAVVAADPSADLTAQFVEPIRVTGTLPVKATKALDATTTLYDFQATKAGWATVKLSGPAGAEVTMIYGERLSPDGTINNGNIQTDRYTLKGGGTESYTPSYSYNGFRYLSINAPAGVTVSSVVGKTLNTDVASSGGFESSSELFNRYHAAMRNSILSNLHSIPTDTPMYEKRGWTADGYLFADSALLNFKSENLWDKWMLDHRDSQNALGQLPVWLPGTAEPRDDPIWTASYIQTNWDLYQYRGDTRVLAEHYDGMRLWLQRFQNLLATTGNLYTGGTFGDHEPAGGGPGNPAPAEFPRTADNQAIGTAGIFPVGSHRGGGAG